MRKTEICMSELNPKTAAITPAADPPRQTWQRPALKTVDAADAEVGLGATSDGGLTTS